MGYIDAPLEDDFWNAPDFNPWKAYVAGGFFVFVCVNHLTKFTVPDHMQLTLHSNWKWRNTLTSFLHSLTTGLWAPIVFYLQPSLADDMIKGYTDSSHALVCFSIGYFLYDFFDMFLYTWHKRSTKEMLVHHLTVVTCFGIAAVNKTYVAYAAISLVVEVNSVFLHGRQLLKFAGKTHTTSYRIVALLNMLTYVFFRILLLGWMTRWLTLHRDDIPLLFFTVGSLGLASIVVINIVNFYRILMSDFIRPEIEKASNSGVECRLTSEALDKVLKNGVDGVGSSKAGSGGVVAEADASNGFHPVSKDVNRFVSSLFSPDTVDSESSSSNESPHENSNGCASNLSPSGATSTTKGQPSILANSSSKKNN